MEFELGKGTLKFSKVMSGLDRSVFRFASLLVRLGIKYVIVSGYIPILLGRSRTTEDVDIFIAKTGLKKFEEFCDELEARGYRILNTSDRSEAFGMLRDGLAIRIAKKGRTIPNFEIKFAKKETDFISLNGPLKVVVNKKPVLMSPLEIQIPFKVWLGSDKDLEDALHIYELFKDNLDKSLLSSMGKKLSVEKKMVRYGIK